MRRFLLVLILVMAFTFPQKVSADAAPPAQPPGTNPVPGSETTQVRMAAETVTINILPETVSGSRGQAKVATEFTMRNLGSQEEKLAVRFPMGANDGYSTWVNINDIVVKVNQQVVPTRVVTGAGDESYFGFAGEIPWVVFDVVFPVDQDVTMQIDYTLEAGGVLPFINYQYIFATGAGWKDSIGSARLIINFPYEISNLNVLPDSMSSRDVLTNQSGSNQLTWIFSDFEPQQKDNFQINLVAPSVWKSITNLKSTVAANPNDGEAWGMLGKLYKQITFSTRGRGFRSSTIGNDMGAQELLNLSKEAYQKAVQLKPDDPLWHAGYADLLGYYANWARYENIDVRPETYQALIQIQTALALDPEDAKVKEIADQLSYELENGLVKVENSYQFPGLTATPELPKVELTTETSTPAPSSSPTVQLSPATITPKIEITEGQSPPQQPAKKGLPICGSFVLVPLGVILWLTRRRIGL